MFDSKYLHEHITKFRFIYKSTKNCFIFWFFWHPPSCSFFMSKFNVERSRRTVATNEPLRHENYNNQNARPFTLLCILWTTLCFRHTENVKIFLFKCQTPEGILQNDSIIYFCFSVFLYLINCSIDNLMNSPNMYLTAMYSTVFGFLGRKQPIISFEIWTIVSIMMISKIKWHSPEYYYFSIKKAFVPAAEGIFKCIWDYPQTKQSNPIYTTFFYYYNRIQKRKRR